jgi:hypothetical protein
MALHDLDFIMCQYAWKLELHDKFWWKSSILNFKNFCEMVRGMHGKVNLWPLCTRCYYIISVCLKIGIIQQLWVEVFHTVCVIHGKAFLRAYANQVALWINMAENQITQELLGKSPISDLKNICLEVQALILAHRWTDMTSTWSILLFLISKEHPKMNIKYLTGSQTDLSVSLALSPSNQQR